MDGSTGTALSPAHEGRTPAGRLCIRPVPTYVGDGGPEATTYKIEFPKRQLLKDFLAKWGYAPIYANGDVSQCSVGIQFPGLSLAPPTGCLISPGGVVRATRLLSQMGLKADVEWVSKRPGTEPVRSVLATLKKVNLALINEVANRRRGLIETGRRKERLNLLVAIIQMHANARCQLLVGSIREGEWLAQRLRSCNFSAAYVKSPQSPLPASTVVISYAGYANANIFDVFLFWDAACATQHHCRQVMQLTGSHRVFGFVDAGWSAERNSARKTFIEALVGPVLDASVSEAQPAQRGLVLLPYRCKVKVNEDADALERKRRLVWQNNGRNSVIADFAAELVGGMERASQEVQQVKLQLGRQAIRVVVLVESPEHAQRLARKLPGWAVVTYDEESINEIRETGGLRGRPILHSTKVIMTTTAANAIYAGGVTCYHNVAIWAGGGQRASRCRILDDMRVVVDVQDRGGKTLGDEARRRIRSYD